MNKLTIALLLLFFLYSCKEKEPLSVIGETDTSVQLIDTFSVTHSTVYVDSLATSASERLLVGKLNNTGMGGVTASSYFQISLKGNDIDLDGVEDILQYASTPVYDSLVLILNHSYSYGDTTNGYSISIHKVSEAINYKSGASSLYNSSYFNYDMNALASTSFNFRNTNDLHVKLSDQIGNELFTLAKNKDYKVANNSNFRDYFNGIVLVPGANSTSVCGFETDARIRLYYHDFENALDTFHYDFVVKSEDLYSSRIVNDRSSTAISSLKDKYQEISSDVSNGESYLLTGVELMPKIKFPTINELKTLNPYSVVNRAELIIYPKENSYDRYYYPPGRLVLYSTNTTNIPDGLISYSNTSYAEVISPNLDWESPAQTYYKFDVTDFIVNKMNNSDSEAALLLASLRSESAARVERLVLGSGSNLQYNLKLRVYLTTFK